MPNKYDYELTKDEIEVFQDIIEAEDSLVQVKLAKAMLLMDKGAENPNKHTVKEVSELTGLSLKALQDLRRRFASVGINAVVDQHDYTVDMVPNISTQKQPQRDQGETTIASATSKDGSMDWELKLMPGGKIKLSIKGDEKPRRRSSRKK